jgi:CheY-like chemotaxis protein
VATILVVDDEYGIAELLEAVLLDEGHRVFTAYNGKHGLAQLETESVDLVFLDYMMPIMDGAQMLSRLCASEELRAIPVVMMSSIPEAAVAERCKGYVKFLRKPFNIFKVLDVVAEILRTREKVSRSGD